MKRGRNTLVLLVLAAGLGAYIYFVESKREPASNSDEPAVTHAKVFTTEAAKIDEITVKGSAGEQTTLRKANNAWQVVTPVQSAADESESSGLATSLAALEEQRVIEEQPKDLAPYPWVVYQQDRDVIVRLLDVMKAAGAAPPAIRVESTSMSALIRLMKAGPYLACVSEALIDTQPDLGLRIVPVALAIWRFPAGMLLHRSLEQHAPAAVLANLVHEQTSRFERKPARASRA